MKESYEKPEAEVIKFTPKYVITTSDSDSDLGDGPDYVYNP